MTKVNKKLEISDKGTDTKNLYIKGSGLDKRQIKNKHNRIIGRIFPPALHTTPR